MTLFFVKLIIPLHGTYYDKAFMSKDKALAHIAKIATTDFYNKTAHGTYKNSNGTVLTIEELEVVE